MAHPRLLLPELLCRGVVKSETIAALPDTTVITHARINVSFVVGLCHLSRLRYPRLNVLALTCMGWRFAWGVRSLGTG